MSRRNKPTNETPVVDKEYNRLMEIFDGVESNHMSFISENIRQLAWYNIRVRELQKTIDEAGTKEAYQNGNAQSGNHINPDLRALIELQKLSNAIVKVLLPLVPAKRTGSKLDEFLRGNFYCGDYDANGLPLDLENV